MSPMIFQPCKPSISISMKHIPERAIRDHRRVFELFCSGAEALLRDGVLQSSEDRRESLYAGSA
jgi:hypothetical protein